MSPVYYLSHGIGDSGEDTRSSRVLLGSITDRLMIMIRDLRNGPSRY